jgi:NitT/TauT family transport system ATP-binding protein
MLVEVEGLSVTYAATHGRGAVDALKNVNLQMRSGEFVALLGPSGCGKTTVLNALAGLLPPGCQTIGRIALAERLRRRGSLGYLPQQDTLLPWRRVLGNVEVPLELLDIPRRERRNRALALLERFGLRGFERSYPHELSGGMRQRVSLIRTLIHEPELILLDEPLQGLDAQTRLLMQEELYQIWRSSQTAFLLVTHDIEEAVALAMRVLILSARPGRILAEYTIDLGPKSSLMEVRWSCRFAHLTQQIWHDLTPAALPLERTSR